jgi:hypothetical protein
MGYFETEEGSSVPFILSREVPYGTVLGFALDGETEPGKVYRLEIYRTVIDDDGNTQQVRKGL